MDVPLQIKYYKEIQDVSEANIMSLCSVLRNKSRQR